MLDNFVFPTLTINDQHSLQQLAFGKYIGPRTFFAGECVFVSAVLFSLEVGQQAMLSCHKVSARLMFMFWEESSILYLTKLLLILCWALLGIAQMLSKLASRLEVDALSPVFSRPLADPWVAGSRRRLSSSSDQHRRRQQRLFVLITTLVAARQHN